MNAVVVVACLLVIAVFVAPIVLDSRPRWHRQAVRCSAYWLGSALVLVSGTWALVPGWAAMGGFVALVVAWHLSGRWAARAQA